MSWKCAGSLQNVAGTLVLTSECFRFVVAKRTKMLISLPDVTQQRIKTSRGVPLLRLSRRGQTDDVVFAFTGPDALNDRSRFVAEMANHY